MRFDYHMHLEYGSYDEAYAEGFVRAAAARGVHEIGFSEHSHTFPEFEQLYYDDLILDDSFVGSFQRKWLKTNKFKYTLDEYFSFIVSITNISSNIPDISCTFSITILHVLR